MDLHLDKGHFTVAGLWWGVGEDLDDPKVRALIDARVPPMLGAASIGDAVEKKVLDHLTNQTSYTMPTPYLALWTSTVDDTSTAATAGELTYTTYARQAISSTNMSPASGAAASVTNDVAITFPTVSSGGGTVTFWQLTSSSSGAGDTIVWGTATSTVISTTQTPPTVAIGGFTITLD